MNHKTRNMNHPGKPFCRRQKGPASCFMLHDSCGRAGFTLPEFLVAMTLFSVVSTFAISSVIAVGNLARSAAAKRAVVDNVHFALETMSRKIKVGTSYHCDVTSGSATPPPITDPKACSSGANSFGFLAADGSTHVEYKLNTATKRIQAGSCQGACTPSFYDLTAPDVEITKLTFFADNSVLKDNQLQPRVLIVVEGKVVAANSAKAAAGDATIFTLQTTLSQRVLEN
ncbi:MAG: type II secretion system protein [Patescibacteria group bacterium]